ncbi:hypothetical protein IQ254_21320 [Nodosilinea sp. LEGE 07088]|uniref:hypothetical protein n=1 Tax=Nodosilinea sp. LEGE 07088 TaxID=2777968 RepID=UPI00187DEEF7|nr:hypothetical protein [Nodosilinea sp. LEGE 07088]MBE9139705.1 hypothetical protein [Nodosilinea sp. LEGE 07088]
MFVGDTATNYYGEAYLESADERILYHYVAELAQLPPDDALARHHLLITKANTLGDEKVQQALQRILLDDQWERSGKYILNRCFYGMRNPWLARGDRAAALQELIVRVKREAPYPEAQSRHLRRLRQALNEYIHSDQYAALEWNLRLLKAWEQPDGQDAETASRLRDRFQDQFYLHEVLTATPDIPRQHQDDLRQLVRKKARLINRQIYAYLKTGQTPKGIIRYREFGTLKTFDDCVNQMRPDRDNSIWQVASQLTARVRHLGMDAICQEIYRFVLEPLARIDSQYSPDLNSFLQGQVLREINRGRDERQGSGGNQFTEIAITTICSHLLKLLVVDSTQRCSATHFRSLLKKVGHATVTEMLLRITLFWPRVRYVLEERFGILLHVHQNKSRQEVPWLTKALEYMKVGLALNGHHLGYFYSGDSMAAV